MLRFQSITSVKNPQIQSARELSASKGRQAQRAFLCEGEHMVFEALAVCPQAVQSVFVEEGKRNRYEPMLEAAVMGRQPVGSTPPLPAFYAVPERVMAALSQVKTPQGIAAAVGVSPFLSLDDMGDRLILLENMQDPGNVGTILRTLDAAGFDGCVLTPGCADPYAPKALRATMGSVFRVPMSFGQAEEVVKGLKERGYAVIAATLSGKPFYEREPLGGKLCLMIGNEGAGLTDETVRAATHGFRLPMRGGAESLNAAIAAAVMMYDVMNRG